MSGLWASGPSRRRSVGDSTKDRRPRLKALAAESAQERRRHEFISTQKRARRNLSDHARLLACLPSEESDIADADEHQQQQQQQQQQHYAYSSVPPEEGGVVGSSSSRGRDRGGDAADCEEDGMAMDDGQARENAVDPVVGAHGVSNVSGVNETSMEERGPTNTTGGKSRAKGKRGGGAGGSNGAAQRAVNRRDHWANQLCTPEWMLTVPNDLNGAGSPVGAGWYVMARPEGKRMLVISAKGETIARQMSGAITHRFSSNLPGGSPAGRRGGSKGGGYCILDCVFHELDQTFFVLDMMAWKGYPLYDCNADFRFYWVRTKLLEADGPLETVTSRNAYRIKPTPYHECDRQGLAHAYSSAVPFIKDGLLFHLKAAHYQLGPTPLVLLWKDSSVARYLGVDSAQAVVLKVGDSGADDGGGSSKGGDNDAAGSAQHHSNSTVSDGGGQKRAFAAASRHGDAANHPLFTADGVCVGEVGREGSGTHIPQARPNDLLRFTLTGAEEEVLGRSEDGTAMVAAAAAGGVARGVIEGLRFNKRCSKLRPMADTWSKVLFQARLRLNSGVSIDEIDAKAKIKTSTTTTSSAGAGEEAEHSAELEDVVGGSGSSCGPRQEGEEEEPTSHDDDDDDEML